MPKIKQAAWHDVRDELSLFRLWVPVCLLVPLILFLGTESIKWIPETPLTPILLCAFAAAVLYLVWQPGLVHLKLLKKLAESCPGVEKTLVRILIIQNGAVTGKDHGVMSCSQGRLIFKGRRSEFSISDQVLEDMPFAKRIDSTKYEVLQLMPGPVELCITNYLYESKPAMGHVNNLLSYWRESELEAAPTNVLPPSSFLPAVRVRFYDVLWKALVIVAVYIHLVSVVRHPNFKDIMLIFGEVTTIVAAFVSVWHSAVQMVLQGKFLRGTLGPRKLRRWPSLMELLLSRYAKP